MTTQILTGNRLDDGAVVFLDGDGGWSENIRDAKIADGEAAIEALSQAGDAALKARQVADAYLIDVVLNIGQIVPVRYREKIRAYGPTTHADFAKQDDVPEHFEHADGVKPVFLNGISG